MPANKSRIRLASRGTFPYAAGQYLYKNGPQSQDALFKAMGNSVRANGRDEVIQNCLRSGWFSLAGEDTYDISDFARAHYDQVAGVVKTVYVGQVAAPREATAYVQPPLSKRHMINSRGLRQDIPTWSVRPAGFGFKTAGGGEA